MSEFFSLLGDFTVYSSVGIAVLYFIGFFKNKKSYKIFTLYLVAMAVVQLTAFYIGRGGYHESNLHISHYYYVLQFVLLTWFYATLLEKNWPYLLMVPMLLFIGYQFINDPSLYFRYNAIAMALTQLIIVVFTIIYLYNCLVKRGPFLLVTGAIFVYLLASSLIFASGNLILSLDLSEDTFLTFNRINIILYFALHIVVVVEWFKYYNAIKSRNLSAN